MVEHEGHKNQNRPFNVLGVPFERHIMKDEDKSRDQLIAELKEMQQRIAKLEKSEAMLRHAEESLKNEAIRRRLFITGNGVR